MIIVKIAKKIISGLSNATFETPNHVFAQCKNQCIVDILKVHFHFFKRYAKEYMVKLIH
jgi:hypothetical protein